MLDTIVLGRDKVVADNAPECPHDKDGYPDMHPELNVFHSCPDTLVEGHPLPWEGERVALTLIPVVAPLGDNTIVI